MVVRPAGKDVSMCGRFAVTTDPVLLAERLGALDETGGALVAPNYNVAPTTDIAAVVARHDEPDDLRRLGDSEIQRL